MIFFLYIRALPGTYLGYLATACYLEPRPSNKPLPDTWLIISVNCEGIKAHVFSTLSTIHWDSWACPILRGSQGTYILLWAHIFQTKKWTMPSINDRCLALATNLNDLANPSNGSDYERERCNAYPLQLIIIQSCDCYNTFMSTTATLG